MLMVLIPSDGARSAISSRRMIPGEYFAKVGSYAGNQYSQTVFERMPTCAAIGLSAAYSTDSTPAKDSPCIEWIFSTSFTTQGKPNASNLSNARCRLDFQRIRVDSIARSVE